MTSSLLLTLQDSNLLPPVFIYIVVGVLGAIIGSFLNVVIHRLPNEESIVFPSSRCPHCSSTIAFYDNLPVVSYLVLRGRCRACKASISPRYPAVEVLTALLFVGVAWRDGLTPALGFDLIFISAIVALIFIDAENMILPDAITYPGMIFAVVARLVLPYLMGRPHFDDLPGLIQGPFAGWPLWAASLGGAALGALIGGGSLWLMGWIWEKVRKVEAMGFGDVKMMFMVGAYFGWRLTILTIFLGALSGSLIGIGFVAFHPKGHMKMSLPFGVFLGIGVVAALLFGSPIVEWYASQYR